MRNPVLEETRRPSGLVAVTLVLDKHKTLFVVLGIQVVLVVLRTLNLYLTGFMTPDEANYAFDVMVGHPYGLRYFFNDQLGFAFRLFSINSFARFEVFFPFYLAAWSFAFLIGANATVGLVTKDRKARAFVMLSLPFAISYSLLSVGFLTEGPALTMCMLGIYAWLRYTKTERRWYLAAASSAAFVAATYTREPYLIFPVVGALAWIAMALGRKVPVRHMMLFVAIALTVGIPSNVYTPAYIGANSAFQGVVTSVPTTTAVTKVVNTTSLATVISTVTTTTGGVVTTITTTSTATTVIPTTTAVTKVVNTTSLATVISTVTTTTGGVVTTITTTNTLTHTLTSTTTEVGPSSILSQGSIIGWAHAIAKSAVLFFVGLVLGWGPILFAISLLSFLLLLRIRPLTRIPWLILFMSVLSAATLYGSVFVFGYYEFHFFLTQGLSNLIRLANTAIPAYVLLSPTVCEKLSERRLKILAVVLIGLTAGSAGFYVTAVQSNFTLPYNVIDFRHKYAPLEARNYLLRNASVDYPAIVFLTPGWGEAQFFLEGVQGVEVYPSVNVFGTPEVNSFQNASYTNALFVKLHPTTFYVLSVHPLFVWNSSLPLDRNVEIIQSSNATFLVQAYGLVFHDNISAYESTTYTIQGVQVIFDSPTGHLLKVHVNWTDA